MAVGLRRVASAILVYVVGVSLWSAETGRAQSGRQLPAFTQTQAWIRLGKVHRVGQIDAPLRTLASWSPAQIQQVDQDVRLVGPLLAQAAKGEFSAQMTSGRILPLKDLASFLDLEAEDLFEPGRPLDPVAVARLDGRPRFEIAKVLARVALLHTDLLMAARDEATGIHLAEMPSTTLRIDDAKRTNVSDPNIYWDAAREAMDLAVPTPRGHALAVDWYRATAEYLLIQRDYALARPHLEHARGVLPGDARLAFYLGTAYENLASPGIQAAVEDGEAAFTIGSRPILLAKAEFHLRSALLLDPGFAEAALHLGRTLELMGRHEEALQHLQRVEAALSRPELQYFAALFSGRAHDAGGREADARAAYERALAQFPDAQSARLALATLTFRSSGQTQALPYVRTPGSGKPAPDPWWSYDVSAIVGMPGHFDALRASAAEVLR